MKRGVNLMLNGGTKITLVFGDPPGPLVLFEFCITPLHESLQFGVGHLVFPFRIFRIL